MTGSRWAARFPDVKSSSVPTPATWTRVVFTASGSWTCPTGVTTVYALVVGGGGAGFTGLTYVLSNVSGAGGGGGGVLYQALTVVPGTVYPVTVGAGGAASGIPQNNGGDSVFSSLTAYGGDSQNYAVNAGSGAGGMWETGTLGAGHILPTSGTAGQGNAGGDTYTAGGSGAASRSSGGGGGAGGAGATAGATTTGGNGGAALTVTVADGTVYTVGGGGGGGASGSPGTVGVGGTGAGTGGTGRVGQNTLTGDSLATSLTVTLTVGDTSGLVVGDYIIGNGNLQGFQAGTRVASIVDLTTFTIDQYPIADTTGAVFGTYQPPTSGTANTGGGGGGAGRPNVAPGWGISGGDGGSGLVVLVY